MCGIFGMIAWGEISPDELRININKLFKLSESRGREASGIALKFNNKLHVYKEAVSASKLLESKTYNNLYRIAENHLKNSAKGNLSAIGHSRLTTNGSELNNTNNQPVVKGKTVLVHNGIIVNSDKLWHLCGDCKQQTELDSEVIAALIDKHVSSVNVDSVLSEIFSVIEGTLNIAAYVDDGQYMLLATNNGSLYYTYSPNQNGVAFASEEHILNTFLKKNKSFNTDEKIRIVKLQRKNYLLISLSNNKILTSNALLNNTTDSLHINIEHSECNDLRYDFTNVKNTKKNIEQAESLFKKSYVNLPNLRRCSKCLLPETFPFIKYNQNGVCQFCTSHVVKKIKPISKLLSQIQKTPVTNNIPDCIVALSGGRDSSYCLHYLVKKLGLRPIAYTYDWGMVTDIARKNMARLCGELGVEHIIISADIKVKRKNIKKNILAWLKTPSLCTVPLFMAGDKQFFYYANILKKRFGDRKIVFSHNDLEKTNFKTGFCGISQSIENKHIYSLSKLDKISLISRYFLEFLRNPAYLNSSLSDTLLAFISYYFIPHDYVSFFDYVKWDEKVINETLANEYGWETTNDNASTWRIGDGTAAFYNYIYYIGAGFTENDTFRSNQIRENMISRDQALTLVDKENKVRVESFVEYCNVLNIDIIQVIKSINSMKRVY